MTLIDKDLRAPDRVAPAARGFTLIELLVVMAIIAVLAGMAVPVFSGVMDRARKVQAKNDVTQIVTAVNAYYAEYGKYPLADVKQGFDTLYGDPNGTYGNEDVFNVLRAIATGVNANDLLNPRKVVFFSASNAKNATKPVSGFAPSDTTGTNGSAIKAGALLDPYGNTYMIAIDGNYDAAATDYLPYLDLTASYTQIGGYSALRLPCFGASFGKDGGQGKKGDKKYTGSDDVLSWQ